MKRINHLLLAIALFAVSCGSADTKPWERPALRPTSLPTSMAQPAQAQRGLAASSPVATPAYDVDGNGVVDVRDVATVAAAAVSGLVVSTPTPTLTAAPSTTPTTQPSATALKTVTASPTVAASPTPSRTPTKTTTPVAASTATSTPAAVTSGLLDAFNRAGPALGPSWQGSGPTIAGNALKGSADGYVYWAQGFGADQWASVKLVSVSGCNSLDLLLKASGTYTNGLVDINYSPCGTPRLLIYTWNPKIPNWTPFKGADVALVTGDVLSAQVTASRVVSVFKNGALIVSDTLRIENAGFDVGRAGQIGLAFGGPNVIVDDFSGGALGTPGATATPAPTASRTPTAAPTAQPQATATLAPVASGDLIWIIPTVGIDYPPGVGAWIGFEQNASQTLVGIAHTYTPFKYWLYTNKAYGMLNAWATNQDNGVCQSVTLRVLSEQSAAATPAAPLYEKTLATGEQVQFTVNVSGMNAVGIWVDGITGCDLRWDWAVLA